MQMLNLKKKFNLRKSQILIIGSFLVFVGIIFLSWNFFITLRDEVYSDLKLDVLLKDDAKELTVAEIPEVENIPAEEEQIVEEPVVVQEQIPEPINYDKYLGVLEIPKIGLKRGFYGIGNRYNSINYNVTMADVSDLPDVEKGNLILMAHSGDAYISYFAYLWRMNVGDYAYVTYNKVKYTYQIVNIYEVPKVGYVTINRDYNKTCLTLITCTKDKDDAQTVYILEQV